MSRPASVLVVDNFADGREMLVEYLSFRGLTVSQASSGAEGLEVARRVKPQIILMDLSMPGIDGWEATRRLKADPVTKGAIVIVLSSHDVANERALAKQAGCDAFVVKPFDLEMLGDALNRIAEKGVGAMEVGQVGLPGESRAHRGISSS